MLGVQGHPPLPHVQVVRGPVLVRGRGARCLGSSERSREAGGRSEECFKRLHRRGTRARHKSEPIVQRREYIVDDLDEEEEEEEGEGREEESEEEEDGGEE